LRVRLTTSSPVRVGGREQRVSKLEFVRDGGKLYGVSPRGLARLLHDAGERALGDWNVEVLRRGQNADLSTFLRREGLLEREAIEGISRYSALCGYRDVNEFQPHARDAFGRLFIPGTALKGAIRAALMWALVDEDEANLYVRRNRQGRARFYADRLERETLQGYGLPGRNLRTGPNHDLLRTVKVSDGYGKASSRVEKITVQSYTESRRGRTASLGASDTIFVECLMPGSWIEFDLKVDEKIMGDFERENGDLPFEDESGLLRLIDEFYAQVWDSERRYYGITKGSEPVPDEVPEGPPSFEEWLRREKGIEEKLSRKNRRPYEAEYRRAFDLFETPAPAADKPPDRPPPSSGIRDGEVKVAKIRDFYGGACPGFRLGWGSGLLSTTVDMRLDEESMGRVLNIISSRHHSSGPQDGPRSRKLVESEGGPRWPLGWASLEAR
jgi:CRISPR-associated protein Csm5